jgi:hypothetical protein
VRARRLPDTDIAWRDVWLGAAVTTALFEIGKLLIGRYIGKQGLDSTYGAAASLVVLLIWVYYSSQLVLMGAEFTRVYAKRRALGHTSAGDHLVPQDDRVDDYVHVAVRRSPYVAAIMALLLGWLFGASATAINALGERVSPLFGASGIRPLI